jgi:hypothetical protein
MRRRAAVLALTALLLAACGAGPSSAPPSDTKAGPSGSPSAHEQVAVGSDPYVHLARALHTRGVDVWFEADLVSAWLAGPATFQRVVRRLGTLAQVPGVVGFKIADELGYHDGIESPEQGLAFLAAAHRALQRVAPRAQVLVDVVVPELGCLPWYDVAGLDCAARARAAAPAATVGALTRYLHTGWIDRLDLSTGLLDPTAYAARGLTLAEAQRATWVQAHRLGWAALTTLQARKALAQPGGFQGTAAEATSDLDVYVDVATASGARAVDIWTWRQPYEGATVSLLAPSLAPNPLWEGLTRLREDGTALLTHMTPSQMPTDGAAFAHECDLAASVFTGVFVAAGTG